jgi:hypothetical protein
MAGFFGLFGGKNKDESYYLDSDDAKTFGNINYMRTPNKSRRTFPKTLTNPDGFEIENEVSAMEMREITENGVAKPKTINQSNNGNSQSQSNGNSSFSSNKRRPSDNGMDVWRNMAKDMRN